MWLQVKELIRTKRNKPFSFVVNGVGMSLAFMSVIIMFLYVRSELDHDRDVLSRADIVRFEDQDWGITAGAWGPWTAGALPEVQQYCRVSNGDISLHIPGQDGVEELFTKEMVTLADSSYPSMFSLEILRGDQQAPLATVEQVMVSERQAKKMFGDADPIGKHLILGNKIKATVCAVFRDVDNPALRNPVMIANLDFVNKMWMEGYSDSWRSSSWETYFRLTAGTDPDEFLQKFRGVYAGKLKSMGREEADIQKKLEEVMVRPYESIYYAAIMDHSNHGNRGNVNILIMIVILVLAVSVINYVNMATARVADKSRMIGLKRTLGAGRFSLIYSIVLDSVITCFLSMLVAWGGAWVFAPCLSEWIGFGGVLRPDLISLLMLFIVMPLGCGLLSGIFPAVYLTRLTRMDSMNSQGNESAVLRYVKSGLMVLQFAISLGLIVSTLIINKQTDYMKNFDLGYDKTNVVVVSGHGERILYEKLPEFRNMLLQNPSVLKVGAAKQPIYDVGEWAGEYLKIPGTDERRGGSILWVDDHFMDMMGLQIVEGEGFREDMPEHPIKYIINQKMAKEIAALSPEHSYLTDETIGVVKDFNFASLHEGITPLFFGRMNELQGFADVYIRIAPGSREKALDYIEQCYTRLFPGTYYQYSFMDDDYARLYGAEDQFARRLSVFTAMSIVIACLGLLAFVAFFIEQKMKSIGVRKVMGATESQILGLLNRDFMRRLLIAFVITCPVVYYIMRRWLSDFAYKTELSWWVFASAFIIMIVIALLSVSFLTWRAATANPVDSLKSE